MDQKTRLLPHLNICYIQRKAYEVHRKKIDNIKYSLKNSRHNMIQIKKEEHSELTQQKHIKQPHRYEMNTIKEEIRLLNDRQSPWTKRRNYDKQKQNKRLMQRLKKCTSTINGKEIQLQSMKLKQIRQRITKFKKSPTSNKTLLKCQLSLQILQKKQKHKLTDPNQHSRSVCGNQFKNQSLSFASNKDYRKLEQIHVADFLQNPIKKKNSLDKIILLRHSQKIKSHFDQSDFASRAKAKLNMLRNSTQIKPRRLSTEVSNNNWKDRCFTTEPQSYK